MNINTKTPEFFSSIIDNVPNGFISADIHGKVTLLNQQTLQYFNIPGNPKDFVGMDFLDFISSINFNLLEKIKTFVFNKLESIKIEILNFSGKLLNIQGRNFPEGMIISIFDTTEVIQNRNQDTLMLLKGEESNRRKIYKELHDGIGSLISTVNLKLDVVKTELSEVQLKTIAKINSVREMMQTATQDLRKISQTLIPSSIIDFGLGIALKELCKTTSNIATPHVRFYQKGFEKRLELTLELVIYRIVQEAFDNSLYHGKSENISLQILQHENYISLTIEDDGIGFDKNKMEELFQKGVGIRNIKTRIKPYNGTFHIDSTQGQGATISIELPIYKNS